MDIDENEGVFHGGHEEVEDAVDIAFPSGKSPVIGKGRRPKSREGQAKKVSQEKYDIQSASPPRKRRAAALTTPKRSPLQSGIAKLVEASMRYHCDKDSVLKQGFAGDGLTPPELREMLRRLFHIKLTDPELSAVFAHFVPDGGLELDGNVFIVHFIQMGQAERDRIRLERLEYERQHMAQKNQEEAKRWHSSEREGGLDQPKFNVEWGPKDEAAAMEMVTEAAVMYDKYSPAAVSLEAFEGATMSPLVFREQLRRVFNIKLSSPQLAALMAKFDKNQDGAVDCAEFLLQFFLVGFQERSRRLEIRRENERKRKEKEEAEVEARRLEAAERARLKVDYNYTAQEQASAMTKVVEAAVLYDATGPACLGLGAFQGDRMPPHVFKEQLRKVFDIKLTPPELGAVMHRFDKDGDGTVDVVEFTKTFFKLGFDERTKRVKQRREAEAQREALKIEEEQRRLREQKRKNASKVSRSFSEEERASAMAKITKAAVRYDKSHPSAFALDAFGGAQMEPHVFQEQLKRAFAIKLTPPELGAAVTEFDTDGDGQISCREFLRNFFRLGFDAKTALTVKRRKHDRAMHDKAAELAAQKEREMEERAALKVTDEFGDEDKASAMTKITVAASRYDKNHPSCLGLDAFEGALMPPHVFKEQLKRVFGLKLSQQELGAVMREFDKDRDGTVNCAEFLRTFFRIGFEARNTELERRRHAEAARAKRAALEESRRQWENERRGRAALAPYTEKDLDETLDVLIETAARYDRRLLGPAGLRAWEVKCMSPTELREALRRTFDVRLTPPQLGVVTHLFGTRLGQEETECLDGDFTTPAQIEIPEFLTTFFKMSAVAKGLAARSDPATKLQEYRTALKERLAQQEEVRRTLKAMRDNPPKRALTVDSGLTRARATGNQRGKGHRGALPMDPGDRIRFQVRAARTTCRLDLSTWATRNEGDFLLSRVPRTVWHLADLRELWLTNNDIQALPPQVKGLRRLRTLGVGGNRISRLPWELGLLCDLEQVFAERNWLSTLPKELASCRKLRELRLSGNQLSRIPDCVCEIRSLEVLDLRGNTIDTLPPALKYLRSLLDLDLQGNPIGPQGKQIEEALRLDFLSVNNNAPSADLAPEFQQASRRRAGPPAQLDLLYGGHCVSRAATVPERRLQDIQNQFPAYRSTSRLPGLDVLSTDAKSMIKAKARKRRAAAAADGKCVQ